MPRRVPVIDCTDLYHPHQDVGDNFDIVAPYALPEVDLRAVILDITDRFRQPTCHAAGFTVSGGPREPGFIPIAQLNYIFDRNIAAAVSPFEPMKSPDDPMTDAPAFQQTGIELFLQTLRQSSEPVEVLIFCSCRTLAVAFNREPHLCHEKIRRVHLSIGCTSGDLFDVDWTKARRLPLAPGSTGYREWNVELDIHAFVRVLRSGLRLALYPCASDCGPFALHPHNSFWMLDSLRFVRHMKPKLRNYLAYALTRELRHDFLRAMDEQPSADALNRIDAIEHHKVWETAIWIEVTGRKLIHRLDVGYRIVTPEELRAEDRILKGDQVPCRIIVRDDGRFDFELTDVDTGVTIYDRGPDVAENQRALCAALPALYLSFDSANKTPERN